jgi:hypothetical protein
MFQKQIVHATIRSSPGITTMSFEALKIFISNVFDCIELVTDRLPAIHHLIVEVVLIALAFIGAHALIKGHP